MVSFPCDKLPSSTTVLSTAASLTAAAVLFRTIAADLIPTHLHDYFSFSLQKLYRRFSSQLTIVIEESDGLTPNHMFQSANIYLSTKLSPLTSKIKVNKFENDEEITVAVDRDQEIVDEFQGIKLKWVLNSTPTVQNKSDRNLKTELKFFKLSVEKKQRDFVLRTYLRFVLEKSKAIKEERKAVRLHTVDYNGTDYWTSIVLNHPATFETMAMEVETKRELIEDLNRFTGRKEYYRRVGKAWKRGYLLYGPPGTGKSSLVAAMANYLKFDVYDLDLREVQCNSDLRRLLIGSGNKSILVIEDIDCNVGVMSRREGEGDVRSDEDDKITLSGLLNFVDGLWSSCGDEKIIVFTTNHKDQLDPVLLRPGRMDVHIHTSYCTFDGFKTLAFNYLRIGDHPLFGVIQELLMKVKATPAQIAAVLMKNDDAEIALGNLIKCLEDKEHSMIEERGD